jgi:large subunit ribosomal protein L5
LRTMAPRLQEKYEQVIRPKLAEQLGITNVMAIPGLEKIVINMGVGEAMQDKKILDIAADAMAEISGQRPVLTKSRKSIAGFKLREGLPIGCMVTLRRDRMYEFLDRLVSIVLPRVRDFRGISRTAFDGHGNYSLGLSEHSVFPELNPDKYTRPQGMNISIVTTAKTNEHAFVLLEMMGLPFRAPKKPKAGA